MVPGALRLLLLTCTRGKEQHEQERSPYSKQCLGVACVALFSNKDDHA